MPLQSQRYNRILQGRGKTLQHLLDVLTAFRYAGVSMNLCKCTLFTDNIKYLGYVIRPGALEVEEASKLCLKGIKHPTSYYYLCSFLGLCNV